MSTSDSYTTGTQIDILTPSPLIVGIEVDWGSPCSHSTGIKLHTQGARKSFSLHPLLYPPLSSQAAYALPRFRELLRVRYRGRVGNTSAFDTKPYSPTY